MEVFQSYKEAHESLHIQGSYQKGTLASNEGITSLKLTANPTSLDRISLDFNRIYYVGVGKKSSQGEPAVHQTKEDQEPFFRSLRTRSPFPVLVKVKPGTILYVGTYRVEAIRPRESKGVRYYEIELSRTRS